MMRVRDRNGERVRGIRARNLRTGQQPRDHRVDLGFLGRPGADHGFLDQPRRVFADMQPSAGGGQHHHAARLPQLERRLRIGIDEYFLHRRTVWAMAGKNVSQLIVKRHQPFGQRRGGVGPDLAVEDVAEAIALGRDQAPASRAESGIEADQDQPSFSITDSGTS